MKGKFRLMWRVVIALVLVLTFSLMTAVPVSAAVGITTADADIDADTFITGLYTDLPAIVITESAFGEIGAGTIILNVPTGFVFRTSADPDVAVTGTGPELAAAFTSISTTQLTVTVTTASTSEVDNVLTIGGVSPIGVKPSQGTPLASGDILTTGSTSVIVGVTHGTTSFGLLDEVHGALDTYTVEPAAGPYTAGAAFDVVITAVDQFDNPLGADYVTDEPYTWATNAADAPDATTPLIGALAALDFTDGVAIESVTLYAAESGVTFTATDNSAITGTSTGITVDHEVLADYTVVPDGLTQTAGTAFDVVITAVDEFENPLGTDYTDPTGVYTWETTASDPSDIDTLAFADFGGAGVATMLVTLNVIETGVTFTATDSNTISGTSAAVAVVAGPAVYLEVTGGATMTAGGTNELTVTAYDSTDNVATSYTGSKTLIFSGPAVAPDATAPTVEGVTMENETAVTFTAGVSSGTSATLIAYNAETTTVDVTDGAIDSAGHGLELIVDPAAAAQLAYTVEPATVVAGVETSVFTVQRQDQYANPVTSGATIVGLASDSTGAVKEFRAISLGDAVTQVTIADAASTADFYYDDEKAGDWTITASATGLTSAESALAVGPATIDHYAVSPIASPQVIGDTFPVTIQAQDEFNNNITTGGETITVTYGVTDGSATPLGAAAITTADGTATGNVRLTVITLGQSITFTGASAAGTSNPFQTVTYGVIDHYEIAVAVGPQEVDTPFDVIIQAKDAAGNDITLGADATEAITITFGLPDAEAAPTTTTTVAGTKTVSMTMKVAQAGQAITFTGASGAFVTTAAFSVYNIIMPLPLDVWMLISTDIWINATDSAWIVDEPLVYKAAGSVFSSEVTLADLKPVEALYVKMGSDEGALGIIFSTGVQEVSAKELVAGWNLISSANSDTDNAQDVLSGLRDVASAGTGLTTVVSQGIYNANSGDFYEDATDWDNLALVDLNASDGYWIRMNAAKTFGVVPQLPLP